MDSLEVKAVIQAFIDFVWRSEGFLTTLVSYRKPRIRRQLLATSL